MRRMIIMKANAENTSILLFIETFQGVHLIPILLTLLRIFHSGTISCEANRVNTITTLEILILLLVKRQ